MSEKLQHQAARTSKSSESFTSTPVKTVSVNQQEKEATATVQEVKPIHQTYIYRSFGGGYQGL